MFDAGFKWIRIGQYENSSDYTSWDWIEQKRGVMAAVPELDDYVDSLVDNGMNIQVQLHVRQRDVHLAVGKAAGRGHAGTGLLSQRRPQFVLGVLAAHHAGANRRFQSIRRLDGEPFS